MKKRGFTLFELLVSISIIGILIAVASMSYSNAQGKARDAKRIQDLENIQKAAETYYSTHNYTYPATSGDVVTAGIINIWPSDPKNLAPYVYPTWASAGTTYCYCVQLDSTTGGNASDAACTFAASGQYFCIRNQQ